MTAAADVDPTAHRPSQDAISGSCEFCGDLTTDPTRCPGWMRHRDRQVYRVEGWEYDDSWVMLSSAQESISAAEVRMKALKGRFPDRPMRIVAETTSYMVVRTAPGVPEPPAERDEMT